MRMPCRAPRGWLLHLSVASLVVGSCAREPTATPRESQQPEIAKVQADTDDGVHRVFVPIDSPDNPSTYEHGNADVLVTAAAAERGQAPKEWRVFLVPEIPMSTNLINYALNQSENVLFA